MQLWYIPLLILIALVLMWRDRIMANRPYAILCQIIVQRIPLSLGD